MVLDAGREFVVKFNVKNHRIAAGTTGIACVDSPNKGGKLEPRFLVIHYTASGPDADIARYFAQKDARVSAHLVVRRDGSATQCVPFNRVAWHAGASDWIGKDGRRYSGLNNWAIGIEIENWGALRKNGDGWLSWTGALVDGTKVIKACHKSGAPDGGWEVFTAEQTETVVAAARAICAAYAIEDIVGHDDIAPKRKSDPGPAWDMGGFKAKVLGVAGEGDAVAMLQSKGGSRIQQSKKTSASQ